MSIQQLLEFSGAITLISPAALLLILGLVPLLGIRLNEGITSFVTQVSVIIGLFGAIAVLAIMLWTDSRHVPIELGDWVAIEQQHFHFHLKFVFDRLSVPFAIMTLVLCGTVGAFTRVYLHRDPGYQRFFLFYAVFFLGMVVSSLAGTIETLFLGWELVGLSSALLIAFFQDRQSPVRNGLRVWCVYRIADAAFMVAALLMHHLTGAGDFDGLMGSGPWPEGVANIAAGPALGVGLLLLVAAAGKSGMVPFSGWLPRAMEGPTPSSAVFYGALSIHLGTYLLLRVSPLLDVSRVLQIAVIAIGAVTAVYGALTSRVQTDVKTMLGFASLTQVGIITVEIGLGFRYLALIHIIGHALLRTLQLLRAPSLLKDYFNLEDAIGGGLPGAPNSTRQIASDDRWQWLYRACNERGYLDSIIYRLIALPIIKAFQWFGRLEDGWTTFLSGGKPAGRKATGSRSSQNDGAPSDTRADKASQLVEDLR
ncbi:proton-conducting transporter transmembrane domain-containing protein [Aureliella helgolandensis]|uniref:NADH-quinone oxidoreductase subunit 12 n=1 Tax=Aureliella helgolandensis TaxID=2527968 RepID=A0A518G7E6_9BACT|nr:proton-conducting transporter membrane subunit [Aureliella helgolandensis]QDV24508.1 NADH-quinone oxidoreductase subunit 12 [Aureliella helgolandensis]